MRIQRKIGLILVLFVGLLAVVIASFSVTRYIFAAYVFPGSDASIRGYPIIEPPEHFTGIWVYYSHTGRRLAVLQLKDGLKDGVQRYFDDDGVPYFVALIARGKFYHCIVKRPVPRSVTIPFFFPQRWLNPSLKTQEPLADAEPNT